VITGCSLLICISYFSCCLLSWTIYNQLCFFLSFVFFGCFTWQGNYKDQARWPTSSALSTSAAGRPCRSAVISPSRAAPPQWFRGRRGGRPSAVAMADPSLLGIRVNLSRQPSDELLLWSPLLSASRQRFHLALAPADSDREPGVHDQDALHEEEGRPCQVQAWRIRACWRWRTFSTMSTSTSSARHLVSSYLLLQPRVRVSSWCYRPPHEFAIGLVYLDDSVALVAEQICHIYMCRCWDCEILALHPFTPIGVSSPTSFYWYAQCSCLLAVINIIF
jgi:hypothetical protein